MTAASDAAWDRAPVGLLRLDRDGLLLGANAMALGWLGSTAADVVGRRSLSDLLAVGGRIYWETHLSPLLHVEGRFDEVALELRTATGRLPVLVSAVMGADGTDVALTSAGERIRFERELQAARGAARTAERQVSALQAVTAALSEAVGVDAIADALLAAVTDELGAAGGALWLADGDARLQLAGRSGAARLDDAGPPEVDTDDGARLVLAVRGQRGLRGVLALVHPTDAGADPLDGDVCRAVALQAGLALERAHVYEQTADVASQLQRALLAADPPVDPRFDVAAVYRPGVEALEVGGDWYDVFLVGPALLGVVVGDVVGRGLAAASAMGQLRSAVRALASPELGPGRLLARLDRFAEQTPAAGMATLAYGELDLVTGRLRWSCAGHPPPLLLPRDGPATLLWGGRATPLGSFTAPPTRAEAEVVLSPGDRLLLCTDGLFERRGRDLGEGLDQLATTAEGLARGVLAEYVTALTDAMLADEQGRDDVCVLLLEWSGDRFERRLGGDLHELSAARRALGGWLRERGVDDPARSDLVLAASEALANAGEHGIGGDPAGVITVAAWLERVDDGCDLLLQVHDGGRWRAPAAADAERGRGLKIIRALVDDVDVRTDGGTTVLLRRRLQAAS